MLYNHIFYYPVTEGIVKLSFNLEYTLCKHAGSDLIQVYCSQLTYFIPPTLCLKFLYFLEIYIRLIPCSKIHGFVWVNSLQGDGVNSYYDQKEYIGRSVHYWNIVLPLLEKIEKRRSIAEPLDPMFMHFSSKDIQVWWLHICLLFR